MRAAFLVCAVVTVTGAVAQDTKPTFHRDVLPILQARCQECHRPGEIAPFSLFTYKETRSWAKAIRESVLSRKMPPWFADRGYGHFSNDRSLSKREVDTLVAWVDSGAGEGSTKDAPEPRKWINGWSISQPDAIFSMPAAFQVPAQGAVDYQYIVIPGNFTEEK